jgi:hypothetical protein
VDDRTISREQIADRQRLSTYAQVALYAVVFEHSFRRPVQCRHNHQRCTLHRRDLPTRVLYRRPGTKNYIIIILEQDNM